MQAKLEALTRVNEDLTRRLVDAPDLLRRGRSSFDQHGNSRPG